MVTLDRIRLTGLLRKAPADAGAFYCRRVRVRWSGAGRVPEHGERELAIGRVVAAACLDVVDVDRVCEIHLIVGGAVEATAFEIEDHLAAQIERHLEFV